MMEAVDTGLRDYNCFPARRSPFAVTRDRRQPSCGEQVRKYGVHYATLVEDEDPLKSWEGTFLAE
jgi:hypothetical protein